MDGFVLTGGRSSRLGRPKEQLKIGGQKLFERSAAALSFVCSNPVTLVGNAGSDLDSRLRVISDTRIDGTDHIRAPIVGLYTALTDAKDPWIALLACDLPFVTGALMAKLAGYCSNGLDAVVPVQPNAIPQPLCGFYRCDSCLPVVEAMMKNNDLKMQKLLSRISTRFVEFNAMVDLEGSANFFLNVNKLADYKTALMIAAA